MASLDLNQQGTVDGEQEETITVQTNGIVAEDVATNTAENQATDSSGDTNDRTEELIDITKEEQEAKKLSDDGVIDKKGDDGYTPLTGASRDNNGDLVTALLKYGAHVDAKSSDIRTPLCYASGLGHIEIVQLLIEAGADVNIKNCGGRTALYYATLQGHSKVAKLLRKAGAK